MKIEAFASAGNAFADLVRKIPQTDWDNPALGPWDLRSLVGHTSIALSSVPAFLKSDPPDQETVANAADYFALIHQFASSIEATSVNEDLGRRAGARLGEDPADAVDGLLKAALSSLTDCDDRLLTVAGGVGIGLSNFVQTRTFELAVHSLDIAHAIGVPFVLPADAAAEATVLAAEVAVANGQSQTVLECLTGRAALPASFSVL